jgi:hypothetical protein
MWSWLIQKASTFLASRVLSFVLLTALLSAGWYMLHTIQQNATLENKLEQANANTRKAERRLSAEIAISKHKASLNEQISQAEDHSGCPEPRIIRDTIRGLHDAEGG